MSRVQSLAALAAAGFCLLASSASGQPRSSSYIGYVYPAGGQQGTTFQVKLGGQGLDDINQVLVTGEGVTAKVVENHGRLGNQGMSLIREQLNELRRSERERQVAARKAGKKEPAGAPPPDKETADLMARIEKRLAEYVNRPACISISSLVFVEVTIAPDAKPGARELRLATPRGVSNPLVFHVGQLPEVARNPMKTCEFQVLGKEELALRRRPDEEVEQRITLPCTVNGQIASGELNLYRFEARKGQRLVLSVAARQLIPFVADAVPGWLQPVLAVYDAHGKELAYADDFRFKPDPVLLFEVPEDGEYLFCITDALYRGREDFVYRVTIGELPFVTSIFPLGGQAGLPATVEMKGWNLEGAELTLPPREASPGVHQVVARKDDLVSNTLPFALDTLPECLDKESNNDASHAQEVKLPVIVNGRIDRADDWDVFQVAGRAGDTIVAEVHARRLDSPLDSMLKVTDAAGQVLAFNDDYEDAGAGVNTHHADSYLMVTLPADGTYCVHLGDTARHGGEEYAYRLRISEPRPDFALRVAPSSGALRSKANGSVSVYAIRKDGLTGDIRLSLKDPPAGFSAYPVTLSRTQEVARLAVRTDLTTTEQPVTLRIEGRAKIQDQELAHEAVPAEDRMQAFLWRHLVPAEESKVVVFDPSYQPPPKRVPPPAPAPAADEKDPAPAEQPPAEKPPADKPPAEKPAIPAPKFTRSQVAGRLRQLKVIYEQWLITDDFYARKVAECEALQ